MKKAEIKRLVNKLRETAAVAGLTREQTAKYLGISVRALHYWYSRKKLPLGPHVWLIEAGIAKIETAHPEPKMTQLPSGGQIVAWWDPDDPDDPDIKLDQEIRAEQREIYVKTMAGASDRDRAILKDAYVGWAEWDSYLRKKKAKLGK